ncbi:MAG: hypoxanthine phosphoribosyltransferase [Proteobacteria bacterium]|nr:hypoxanthine phosphoribosyltransferase [Pseudomonadota bacterium]
MENYELKEIIGEKQIKEKILVLSEKINSFFQNSSFIAIGVLKGALFFMADLIPHLRNCETYDFIQAKSYEGSESTGSIKILKEPSTLLENKNVLVIEDILDTGITATAIKDYLLKKGAKNIYFCALLDKPSRRIKQIVPDFCGFVIDNYFVVGYGLDYEEKFREKRGIYIFKLKD